jgi:hypothetical protein
MGMKRRHHLVARRRSQNPQVIGREIQDVGLSFHCADMGEFPLIHRTRNRLAELHHYEQLPPKRVDDLDGIALSMAGTPDLC